MNVCVLGGGRQGRVIAADLAAHAKVTVVDAAKVDVPKTKFKKADLSNQETVMKVIDDFDLVVGALPARLGFQAAQAAVQAQKNFIDIAFYEQDAASLHESAEEAGVFILPDCGVAPGISNLVVGRELAEGNPDEIHIKVGGFAADSSKPYGYVITWSVDDLLDEYTRPARIIRGGQVVSVPALSGIEKVDVEGVGTLEAFFTDGLRTLLGCGVKEMTEMTLRWPGHADAVRPLVGHGTFIDELRQKCTDGDDMVVMLIDVVRGGEKKHYQMIDRAREGMSAMARTTALTCAAFARLAIEGGIQGKGVVPPEKIGADEKAYTFIMDALAGHGIEVK